MKFVWDDKYAEIGMYNCKLIDGDDVLENIEIIDYTKQEGAHCFYPYSFEVNVYYGALKQSIQMQKGFDYDSAYRNHIDENGNRMYGYNGVCMHTIEDVKRFCENYLAERYINLYNCILPVFNDAKRRASWFVENGYGENADD